MNARFKLLASEFVLGTLVAILSILTAVSGYQSSMADSDQTKYNVQGQQMLTDANAEYLTANQMIVYDYSLYDGWYTAEDEVKSEYYHSSFSQELQDSIAANEEDPFSEGYYEAMYLEPSQLFDEADALFTKAEAFNERGDALQLIMLISALGLAFAAWASLLSEESLVRLVFAFSPWRSSSTAPSCISTYRLSPPNAPDREEKMKKLSYRLLTLMLIFVLMAGALAGCGEDTSEDPGYENEPAEVETTDPIDEPEWEEEPVEESDSEWEEEPVEESFTEDILSLEAGLYAPDEAEPDTWLVMLYMDADDEVLENDIFIDLNEAELVGSTDQLTIVAQIDRYQGGYDGDGDWTSTKRFLVTEDPDGDLEALASEELEDLGEMDMGDPATLVDFATWAIQNYPAEKRLLVLSDHGMGWPGGWTDNDPNEFSEMHMNKIADALEQVVVRTGIGQIDVVGFDACLMGQLEVFSSIAPFARYAIGSEETEPAMGWAYNSFLGALKENPALSAEELAVQIVNTYIDQDALIIDEAARRRMVERNFGVQGDFSAEEVASHMSSDITLTAVDLSAMIDLNAALNDFALVLAGMDQGQLAQIRSYSQSYTSIFGKDSQPSYIDLGHFASLVEAESGDDAVSEAAANLFSAMENAILAEKHGEGRPGSTGLTIYFPNSELYQQTVYEDWWLYYLEIAGRFAAASLWDDLLTFHYGGPEIDPANANLDVLAPQETEFDLSELALASAPDRAVSIQPPAAEEIGVSEITLSASEISADEAVTLSATITGKNVSYIYYYAALYNEEDGSYLTADMGYIGAEESRQVGGIYYPDWGDEGVIEIEVEWEPTVYFLSNGDEASDQFAFFEPEVYGANPQDNVYTVYGLYTAAGTSEQREAMIQFDGDGKMKRVLVFTSNGAPREISLEAGDSFTIWEEWLEYDQETEEWDFVYYEGGTLTYEGVPFTIVPYSAYPGDYEIGLVVEDFDGNLEESYAELRVTE